MQNTRFVKHINGMRLRFRISSRQGFPCPSCNVKNNAFCPVAVALAASPRCAVPTAMWQCPFHGGKAICGWARGWPRRKLEVHVRIEEAKRLRSHKQAVSRVPTRTANSEQNLRCSRLCLRSHCSMFRLFLHTNIKATTVMRV